MLDIRATSEQTSDGTWKWEAHLDDQGSGDLNKVEYVEYTLHQALPEPVRRVDDPKGGFRVEAEIKRSFVLKASVYFKDGAKQRLTHRVQVRESGESLYEVREDELIYIKKRRQLLDSQNSGQQPKTDKESGDVGCSLAGLALSGGGIRSATTNLGVLQALSRMDILPKVDYLCTVSGGGYIGGCLSALLSVKRTEYTVTVNQSEAVTLAQNAKSVSVTHPEIAEATVVAPNQFLITGKTVGTTTLIVLNENSAETKYDLVVAADAVENRDRPWSDAQHIMKGPDDALFATKWKRFPFRDEPGKWPWSGRPQVKQLRTHGNFLVARKGFFTTETLRSIGGVLTGIVFHWTLFLLAFAFIAALGLYVTLDVLAPDAGDWVKDPGATAATVAETTISSATIPAGGESPRSSGITFTVEAASPSVWRKVTDRVGRVAPAARDFAGKLLSDKYPFRRAAVWGAALAPAVFIVVGAIIVGARNWGRPKEGESREDAFHRRWIKRLRWLAGATVLVAVALNRPVENEHSPEPFLGLFLPITVTASFWIAAFAFYVLLPWGEITAWRGRTGRAVRHLWTREFRSSWGSILALATYWVFAAAGVLLFPFLVAAVREVGIWTLLAAVASALASRGLVTRLGGTPGVPGRLSPSLKRFALGLLVATFIALMVLTLAAWFVDWTWPKELASGLTTWLRSWSPLNFLIINTPNWFASWSWTDFPAIAAGSFVLFWIVGIAGNSNKIGLHYFYRDRLIETYLRTEVANRNLTLDLVHDSMDMRLKELHGVAPSELPGEEPDYRVCVSTAPYHLLSTAINIAERRDLTRKDRKSGYFIFSKLYCGSYHTNFRATDEYQAGEVKLGRAMTISGAAVGSGMGYHTFFAQAFATTLFNIRLGYWMENPGNPPKWFRGRAERPIISPPFLLKEMLSWTHARGRLVNLSDGGHTGDNVGIYPLLQRRCQVIIACDAEADPELAFGSFTEALRHAYVDMNIDVDIDLTMIRPDPATGRSRSHCAIGRIKYPEPEPGELPPPKEAWLIYLKNSLTGDEPEPVKNYKVAQSDFPHETTVDQFFDDAQFESYRALGDHLAEHTFAPALGQGEPLSERCLRYLQAHHSSFEAADDPDYRSANQRLAQLERDLAADEDLRWYYEECYLAAGRNTIPPQYLPPGLTRVFLAQVRLLEYVFVTLELGRYGNAPDNRGWMNLFRSWGRSLTFRAEFERVRGTFTKRFENFYDQYIKDRKSIDEDPIPHPWDQGRPADVKGVFLDPGRREARAP
jgi:hypothetical protein